MTKPSHEPSAKPPTGRGDLLLIWALLLGIALAVGGCKPGTSAGPVGRASGSTEESFQKDLDASLESYCAAADPASARAALLAWESVLSEYEAAGTKRIQLPYHQIVVQGRLFAVHSALGDTNAAAACRTKLAELMLKGKKPGAKGGELQPFLESVETLDAEKGVKWRQAK